jgi:glycosyltransferase involved in cell wall biosynthesis
MISVSVIVCSRNPRRDYLRRVLQSLREQTVPPGQWELLLVDNASTEPLASTVDLTWHMHARHVRELSLGVASARLRGIVEAKADLLVFADDDTALKNDYIAHARVIASEHPKLGAWSGNVRLEFEQPPPAWTQPYWRLLAERKVAQDAESWSTSCDFATVAWGGGMCLRREVGLFHRQQWMQSPSRQIFGPKGQSLISAEDTDLALAACDMGMGTGIFARLEVTHFIPPERLSEEYLLSLCRARAMSSLLLRLVRGTPVRRLPHGFRWWARFGYDCVRKWGRKRRFYLSEARGQRAALEMFGALQLPKKPSSALVEQSALGRTI